jgi:NAD(P)-dependent dehydrogenase (short-subunit alcohol dehydrogenase family)
MIHLTAQILFSRRGRDNPSQEILRILIRPLLRPIAMSRKWQASDIPSLTNKRVLITGANSGIGYHAALKLARKGAHVLLACRNRQRGEAALARLHTDSPGIQAELIVLDLASRESIRKAATAELAQHRPLHLLINNAAVFAPPTRQETSDGFELQFGTNVLGHFALTAMLFPALQQAANESDDSAARPRIVTIASIAHKRAQINFGDLHSSQSYSPMRAYQQSKLANLLFTFELDRRLRATNSRIMSVAAHPGVAHTNLFKSGDYSAFEKTVRSLFGHVIGVVLNSDSEGALPTLYAATAADAKDGGYYGPQGFQEMRGHEVGPAFIAPQAVDVAAAARLWQVSEEHTGLKIPLRS